MVSQHRGDGNILGCGFDVTRHVVAHTGDTCLACLLDEHTELFDTLTLVLFLLWMRRQAALSRLALQNRCCSGGCQVDDAGAAQRIGWQANLVSRSNLGSSRRIGVRFKFALKTRRIVESRRRRSCWRRHSEVISGLRDV